MFNNTAAHHLLALENRVAHRVAVSKHRQFDPQTGKHIPGRCRIGDRSGLRKLMRAARRGKIPPERLRVMLQTMQSAAANLPDYMTGHMRRRRGIVLDAKTLKWTVQA